jgi:putative Mg2+ transporter-C (MgtC) family protein
VTVVVLAGNTLLRPVVDYINRRPLDAESTEALYQVQVICAQADVGDARDLLDAELEKAHYPIASIEVLTETEEQVELTALLIPTTADPAELDAVCAALETHEVIENATWTVSAAL